MTAIVINSASWDCAKSMPMGYDLVIKIISLFTVAVYPTTKKTHDAIRGLNWEKAELYPIVSFSFSPMTEPEIIALIRETFKNIEIFSVNKVPD